MDIFLAHAIGRFGFEGDLTTGNFVVVQGQRRAVETWRTACALLVGRIDLECKFLEKKSMRPQAPSQPEEETHQAIIGANEATLAGSTEVDGDMIRS